MFFWNMTDATGVQPCIMTGRLGLLHWVAAQLHQAQELL